MGSLGRRRHDATMPLTISSRCLLPDLPESRRLAQSPWRGVFVDDGLYCNDSDDTFSDATYEYGDDDDYDVETFGVGAPPLETFGVGAPPLPPPTPENIDDALPLWASVTQEDLDDAMELYAAEPDRREVAFSLMIDRAQQARIYAAHAARAPEYAAHAARAPESAPESTHPAP